LVAKPPFAPSAKIIELTVTVFPAPMFLLLKDDEFVWVKVSDPMKPDNETETVAEELPS